MVINPDGWTRLAYPFFLHHGYFATATNHDFWRSSVGRAGFDIVEIGTQPATLYVLARKGRAGEQEAGVQREDLMELAHPDLASSRQSWAGTALRWGRTVPDRAVRRSAALSA